MKVKWLLLILIFFTSPFSDKAQSPNKNKLLGNDYRLFQETPAWGLAKAVWNNNIVKIKKIITAKKVDIDFQEPIFGQTLLMLAVTNEQYNVCKTLLELGADPNKHDTYDGSSAIVNAAQVSNITNDNTQFLKLLLKFKGNPNDVEIGERHKGNPTRNSVLIASIQINKVYSPLSKVKLLIEHGADINYKNEFEQTALKKASILGIYDVVLYLLQKGVNYQEPIIDRSKYYNDGEKVYLINMLREYIPPLDSEDYKQKVEVIEFLKTKGIDYKKAPIPDFTLNKIKEIYPTYWKEYVERY